MNLTPQQMNALDHGNIVPVTLEGRDCVVVLRDVYEQTTARLEEERDVIAMQPFLADLAPEDWEDAANYEQP